MPTERRKKKGPKLEFDRRPVLWSLSWSQVRGPVAAPHSGRSPCSELRARRPLHVSPNPFRPFPRTGADKASIDDFLKGSSERRHCQG